MSTTDPTTTFTDVFQSTSTPTSSSSPSDSDTATLYLFTFLATILILVLLSASLVLRSYILRRRYRQRFQQALADNTLFANLEGSSFGPGQFDPLRFRRSARRIGPKPVLWDTWVHPVNENAWSSFTPVAVRCIPSSPPSTSVSSPQPPTTPPPLPQRHPPSLFSQLHLLSPFSLSRSSSSGRATGTPTLPSTQSSPPPPPLLPTLASPTTEKGVTTLTVCVLVAMPDASVPIHHGSITDTKGKGVDPLESQVHPQTGVADPLLPSSKQHRSSGECVPDLSPDDDSGLPLLEFGVVEVSMQDGTWS